MPGSQTADNCKTHLCLLRRGRDWPLRRRRWGRVQPSSRRRHRGWSGCGRRAPPGWSPGGSRLGRAGSAGSQRSPCGCRLVSNNNNESVKKINLNNCKWRLTISTATYFFFRHENCQKVTNKSGFLPFKQAFISSQVLFDLLSTLSLRYGIFFM